MTDLQDQIDALRAENGRLKAENERLKDEDRLPVRTALRARIAELEERLADYEESYRMTINGQCAPDEKHCSCVPHLRARVAELEQHLANVLAVWDLQNIAGNHPSQAADEARAALKGEGNG